MRSMEIYRNGNLAGVLTEESRQSFVFRYEDAYLSDSSKAAISLTLPKSQRAYQSERLFPFFANMLSEGVNRALQCRQWKLDESDDFGLLLATAQHDTIGAITVKPVPAA
ncbi:MAG: HipA N-terminal domain-containing protein [Saprospiraceae bacterium]|nr:HipA N-terminal domain-containing protein [Saprospiraceae bacterium]